jgi:hypothetical protein
MKVTQTTKNALQYRRAARALKVQGFERVELYRNAPGYQEIITDVVIGPGGTSLWWKRSKIEPPPSTGLKE